MAIFFFIPLLALLLFNAPASAQVAPIDSQRQEILLFQGQQTIGPGRRWHVKFTSEPNHRNARIAGNVQARGGSGDDIRVLVLKGQSVVYDSGRRRSVVLSVDCSEPGNYSLVLDNSFSLFSSKVAFGEVSLVHSGDGKQNAADQREANERYSEVSGIFIRLHEALNADEHFWRTSQLGDPPSIRFSLRSVRIVPSLRKEPPNAFCEHSRLRVFGGGGDGGRARRGQDRAS